MAFNFDEEINRRHSDSIKWNAHDESVLPMWVADTDFRSPACITDALIARVQHGVFGYGAHPQGLAEAFIEWCQRRYQWRVEPEWLVFLPGIVAGLNLSVRAFTSTEETTVAPTPIYPPFRKSAALAGRAQRKRAVAAARRTTGAGSGKPAPAAYRARKAPDAL
ncbi:Putative aminotransferase [Cronobacter sakazakii 696]|nr:Putative aminotransferase [Cronobacter sakazakii 696]